MKKSSKAKFNLNYFTEGPYKQSVRVGFGKYFNQFYWARRYYARLIKKYQKKGKLLEIGCGFGDQIKFLDEDFACLGIDISREAITIAQKENTNAHFQVMKAEQMSAFGKGQFDVILANYVLEHLKDPHLVISLCHQLLKPGGYLFMVVPNLLSWGKLIKKSQWVGFRDKTHISLYPPDQWEQMLTGNNFQIVKKFGDGLWDVPYVGFVPKILQLFLIDFLGIIQTLFCLSFLPLFFGEGLIVVARKKLTSQR